MAEGQKNIWLAAHLYYNEPWEEFLTKAVEPYVVSAIRTGVVDQYFFIRYWDRGPHIRLRFKGNAEIIEQIFRPNLLEHFENYFEDKPSKRTNPNYPVNFPEEFKWLPNNSVQFFNYEPELERYGGTVGVQIAEEHFQISSDAALANIKERSFKWTYEDAMGAAIKLHLSFIFTMGFDLKSAVSFFRMVFYNWLPRSFRFFTKGLSREEYRKMSRETIDDFTRAFEMQKSALIPFHQSLWEGLEEKSEFEEETLNTWVQKNQGIKSKLDQAMQNKQLTTRSNRYQLPAGAAQNIHPDDELLWNFYADYLHMTNNRLGILNKDEGYLGFLIMESLKALYSGQNSTALEVDFLASKSFEKMMLDELF